MKYKAELESLAKYMNELGYKIPNEIVKQKENQPNLIQGKRIAIIGRVYGYTKKELLSMIEEKGGIYMNIVTPRLDYLVMDFDTDYYDDINYQFAIDYQNNGSAIEIIDIQTFLEMLLAGNTNDDPLYNSSICLIGSPSRNTLIQLSTKTKKHQCKITPVLSSDVDYVVLCKDFSNDRQYYRYQSFIRNGTDINELKEDEFLVLL